MWGWLKSIGNTIKNNPWNTLLVVTGTGLAITAAVVIGPAVMAKVALNAAEVVLSKAITAANIMEAIAGIGLPTIGFASETAAILAAGVTPATAGVGLATTGVTSATVGFALATVEFAATTGAIVINSIIGAGVSVAAGIGAGLAVKKYNSGDGARAVDDEDDVDAGPNAMDPAHDRDRNAGPNAMDPAHDRDRNAEINPIENDRRLAEQNRIENDRIRQDEADRIRQVEHIDRLAEINRLAEENRIRQDEANRLAQVEANRIIADAQAEANRIREAEENRIREAREAEENRLAEENRIRQDEANRLIADRQDEADRLIADAQAQHNYLAEINQNLARDVVQNIENQAETLSSVSSNIIKLSSDKERFIKMEKSIKDQMEAAKQGKFSELYNDADPTLYQLYCKIVDNEIEIDRSTNINKIEKLNQRITKIKNHLDKELPFYIQRKKEKLDKVLSNIEKLENNIALSESKISENKKKFSETIISAAEALEKIDSKGTLISTVVDILKKYNIMLGDRKAISVGNDVSNNKSLSVDSVDSIDINDCPISVKSDKPKSFDANNLFAGAESDFKRIGNSNANENNVDQETINTEEMTENYAPQERVNNESNISNNSFRSNQDSRAFINNMSEHDSLTLNQSNARDAHNVINENNAQIENDNRQEEEFQVLGDSIANENNTDQETMMTGDIIENSSSQESV